MRDARCEMLKKVLSSTQKLSSLILIFLTNDRAIVNYDTKNQISNIKTMISNNNLEDPSRMTHKNQEPRIEYPASRI
jgi:hypothetical protein